MPEDAYTLRPIQTEADYRAALQFVVPYFENEPEIGSDTGMYFEAMLALIQAYEVEHHR